MRALYILLGLFILSPLAAQNTHALIMNGEEFIPDTVYLVPGDSIHLTFDTTGHSMVQVPEQSWIDEVAAPLIGISLGEGTPNPGDFHTFSMDSEGTFYYVCQQHPGEKGVIMVGDEFTSVTEMEMPGFTVYPQPASDVIHIDHAFSVGSLRIDDHNGRQVRSLALMHNEGVDITMLPAGMYFLTILDAKGEPIARERVIISR